jgi:hypothetical protein
MLAAPSTVPQPCPFCGSGAHLEKYDWGTGVACSNKECNAGIFTESSSYLKSISRWNKRFSF